MNVHNTNDMEETQKPNVCFLPPKMCGSPKKCLVSLTPQAFTINSFRLPPGTLLWFGRKNTLIFCWFFSPFFKKKKCISKATVVKMISYYLKSTVSHIGKGGFIGDHWIFNLRAWKRNIKVMRYDATFANFCIWKPDIWDSPFMHL